MITGTKIHAKHDFYTRLQICKTCGQRTILQDFTGDVWRHLGGVPVVRSNTVRRLDECSACGAHETGLIGVWKRERLHELEVAADTALEQADTPYSALELLCLYHARKEPQAAVTLAGRLEEAFTDNPEVLTQVGIHHVNVGDAHTAANRFEQALALEDHPVARFELGRLLLNRGELGRSTVALLEQASVPGPFNQLDTLRAIGDAYHKAGRHDAALGAYEALFQSYPPRSRQARPPSARPRVRSCDPATAEHPPSLRAQDSREDRRRDCVVAPHHHDGRH